MKRRQSRSHQRKSGSGFPESLNHWRLQIGIVVDTYGKQQPATIPSPCPAILPTGPGLQSN